MTSDEERYVHFVQCTDDLNEAWSILQEIRRAPDAPFAGAAFRYALIAYARSYKTSRGESQRNHKLDTSFVPPEHLKLHRRILDSRDQILAHSDLTVREARVHVAATSSGKLVGVVQNLLRGTEDLAHLDSVVDLIENTLDGMYRRVRELEQLLPVSGEQRL